MRRTLAIVGLAAATVAEPNFTVSIEWDTTTDQPYMSGAIAVGTPPLNLSAMFLMNFEETVVMS